VEGIPFDVLSEGVTWDWVSFPDYLDAAQTRGSGINLGFMAAPLYCTRTASRLVRTYTDRHGLKDLVRELLGHEISKQQQTSDWGAPELSDAQREYAASDVRYLHALKEKLDERLVREKRVELAQSCFDFLPHRALLDLAGWPEQDIFAHDG